MSELIQEDTLGRILENIQEEFLNEPRGNYLKQCRKKTWKKSLEEIRGEINEGIWEAIAREIFKEIPGRILEGIVE